MDAGRRASVGGGGYEEGVGSACEEGGTWRVHGLSVGGGDVCVWCLCGENGMTVAWGLYVRSRGYVCVPGVPL